MASCDGERGSGSVADHGTIGRAPRRSECVRMCGTSPCVVAGYSFQGKVVVEAARALQQARRQPRVGLSHRFHCLDWDRPPNTDKRRRGICAGLARPLTGPLTTASYTKSLSASLRNSWRLLRWLLAQAPPGVKRRLGVCVPRTPTSTTPMALSTKKACRSDWRTCSCCFGSL